MIIDSTNINICCGLAHRNLGLHV